MTDIKQCNTCGKDFHKKVNVSRKKWGTMKYCSNPCINKGRVSRFRGQRPMSEERKQHLRKVLKGRTTNTGRTHFRKGEHYSVETQFKKGDTSYWKGKKNLYFTGPNNPRWREGIYPEHLRVRHSVEMKNFRNKILERDNYTCKFCGRRSKIGDKVILNIHHLKHFATHEKLRFDENNVITLCKECHKKTHKK